MSINCKPSKKMKAQIHCPVSGCLYFYGSERHFTLKKFLNQHIAKVHAEKKFPCGKCPKSFGLDWWRKHHEKTCGMEWKCHCGVKYASRESLLTHSRRSQHKLPDHVWNPDKPKQTKAPPESNKSPVIILIQPVIQHLTCIQPMQNFTVNTQPILPKPIQPRLFTLPVSGNNLCNTVYSSSVIQDSNDNVLFNLSSNSCNDTMSHQLLSSTMSATDTTTSNSQKPSQKTSATQTTDDLECPKKSRESRASQCTRRKSKVLAVGIESTHTQTAESTVVKIKKKRSRRKSVAITTESSMLTHQNLSTGQSLWPDFKDLILPNTENSINKSYKNTTSTQTSSNKVLCDSETITDDELFKFVWDEAVKGKDNSECFNSLVGMLPDMSVDDTMATMQDDIDQNNLPMLDMFSSNNSVADTVLTCDIKRENTSIDGNSPTLNPLNSKEITDETCSIFSVFEDCSKPGIDSKVTLSDIHTQTIASTVLDYNLLANMETQTTDDFSLLDLEFSDTETQTPWEDFPNIDDSPLPADQLSIEIQTDFSSLNSSMDQDPYKFINELNVQSMIGECSNKETLGVNIETQTQDGFTFPQFTNSESQTLDLSHFMFSSLNSS